MTLKKISLLAAINLALLSPIAHADIIIEAPYMAKGDLCTQLKGTKWIGVGEADEWGLIDCYYTGKMDIDSPADGKITINNLTLDLDPSKKSSGICPSHKVLDPLQGTCANDKIVIADPGIANLNGTINADYTSHVTGTATFTIGIFKFNPDVTMDIKKTS